MSETPPLSVELTEPYLAAIMAGLNDMLPGTHWALAIVEPEGVDGMNPMHTMTNGDPEHMRAIFASVARMMGEKGIDELGGVRLEPAKPVTQ